MSLPRREFGPALGLLLLAVATARPLAAQVHWSARVGATYTSAMVTDQIAGSEVTLRPTISPTLAAEVALPLRTRTPLDGVAEVAVTTGTLQSHQNGAVTRVAAMRTVALTAGIRGRFTGPLRWRGEIGFLSYATSEKTGVFQAGVPTRPAGVAALDYERRLAGSLRLEVVLRYDVHGFTTKQLESNGYTGSQTVHRVGLSVGVGR